MNTVFANHMVAHVWAQQSQESGRSHNGNFSFQGTRLYGYNTMIANFVSDARGNKVPLFTSKTYSVTTTGKHMRPAHGAVNYTGYTVPSISDRPDHEANLVYLESVYRDEVIRLRRCRELRCNVEEHLQRFANTATSYAEVFDLKVSALDPVGDAAEVLRFRAERDAKRNAPAATAKRERERQRRNAEEIEDFRECKGKWPAGTWVSYRDERKFSIEDRNARNARLAILHADKIAAWRRGEVHARTYDGDIMLRVRGDIIEASCGATFPVEHGRRAFPLIKACHDNKREFEPAGRTIHLGHFTIAKIDASGNVTTGCQFVRWEEIERVAQQLGIADDPGNVITLCA